MYFVKSMNWIFSCHIVNIFRIRKCEIVVYSIKKSSLINSNQCTLRRCDNLSIVILRSLISLNSGLLFSTSSSILNLNDRNPMSRYMSILLKDLRIVINVAVCSYTWIVLVIWTFIELSSNLPIAVSFSFFNLSKNMRSGGLNGICSLSGKADCHNLIVPQEVEYSF
jgi:hypothetical protein